MWPDLATRHVPNGIQFSIEKSSIVVQPEEECSQFPCFNWVVACCIESVFGLLRNPCRRPRVFWNKSVVEPMCSWVPLLGFVSEDNEWLWSARRHFSGSFDLECYLYKAFFVAASSSFLVFCLVCSSWLVNLVISLQGQIYVRVDGLSRRRFFWFLFLIHALAGG